MRSRANSSPQANYDAGDVVLTYESSRMLSEAGYSYAGRGITAETASQREPIEIGETVALGAL